MAMNREGGIVGHLRKTQSQRVITEPEKPAATEKHKDNIVRNKTFPKNLISIFMKT
jgi:hypothetical protein